MITSTTVNVTYSNNKKYYISKGYPDLKQGSVVEVNVYDLPKNSNKKINCLCDNCNTFFKRSLQILLKQRLKQNNKDLCFSCARKRVGKIMNTEKIINSNSKRIGDKHPRWNNNKKEYEIYRKKVLYYTERQPLFLLENSDKKRTLCGVEGGYQLDHIFSIKQGFEMGIEPKFVGSLVNLRYIPWEKNRAKGSESNHILQVNTFTVNCSNK